MREPASRGSRYSYPDVQETYAKAEAQRQVDCGEDCENEEEEDLEEEKVDSYKKRTEVAGPVYGDKRRDFATNNDE